MRRFNLLAVVLLLFIMATPASAAGPSLSVTSPKEGVAIAGSTLTVTFTTADIKLVPTTVPVAEAGKHPEVNRAGEGHLHFVLDLQPLVVWEKGDPYTFANVPPGEHQLMVELVQNDHSSLSPSVMQTIHFSTVAAGQVPAVMPTTGADTAGTPGLLLFLALLILLGGFALRRKYGA
jgi:MYXO-CTERM domain-containing protein